MLFYVRNSIKRALVIIGGVFVLLGLSGCEGLFYAFFQPVLGTNPDPTRGTPYTHIDQLEFRLPSYGDPGDGFIDISGGDYVLLNWEDISDVFTVERENGQWWAIASPASVEPYLNRGVNYVEARLGGRPVAVIFLYDSGADFIIGSVDDSSDIIRIRGRVDQIGADTIPATEDTLNYGIGRVKGSVNSDHWAIFDREFVDLPQNTPARLLRWGWGDPTYYEIDVYENVETLRYNFDEVNIFSSIVPTDGNWEAAVSGRAPYSGQPGLLSYDFTLDSDDTGHFATLLLEQRDQPTPTSDFRNNFALFSYGGWRLEDPNYERWRSGSDFTVARAPHNLPTSVGLRITGQGIDFITELVNGFLEGNDLDNFYDDNNSALGGLIGIELQKACALFNVVSCKENEVKTTIYSFLPIVRQGELSDRIDETPNHYDCDTCAGAEINGPGDNVHNWVNHYADVIGDTYDYGNEISGDDMRRIVNQPNAGRVFIGETEILGMDPLPSKIGRIFGDSGTIAGQTFRLSLLVKITDFYMPTTAAIRNFLADTTDSHEGGEAYSHQVNYIPSAEVDFAFSIGERVESTESAYEFYDEWEFNDGYTEILGRGLSNNTYYLYDEREHGQPNQTDTHISRDGTGNIVGRYANYGLPRVPQASDRHHNICRNAGIVPNAAAVYDQSSLGTPFRATLDDFDIRTLEDPSLLGLAMMSDDVNVDTTGFQNCKTLQVAHETFRGERNLAAGFEFSTEQQLATQVIPGLMNYNLAKALGDVHGVAIGGVSDPHSYQVAGATNTSVISGEDLPNIDLAIKVTGIDTDVPGDPAPPNASLEERQLIEKRSQDIYVGLNIHPSARTSVIDNTYKMARLVNGILLDEVDNYIPGGFFTREQQLRRWLLGAKSTAIDFANNSIDDLPKDSAGQHLDYDMALYLNTDFINHVLFQTFRTGFDFSVDISQTEDGEEELGLVFNSEYTGLSIAGAVAFPDNFIGPEDILKISIRFGTVTPYLKVLRSGALSFHVDGLTAKLDVKRAGSSDFVDWIEVETNAAVRLSIEKVMVDGEEKVRLLLPALPQISSLSVDISSEELAFVASILGQALGRIVPYFIDTLNDLLDTVFGSYLILPALEIVDCTSDEGVIEVSDLEISDEERNRLVNAFQGTSFSYETDATTVDVDGNGATDTRDRCYCEFYDSNFYYTSVGLGILRDKRPIIWDKDGDNSVSDWDNGGVVNVVTDEIQSDWDSYSLYRKIIFHINKDDDLCYDDQGSWDHNDLDYNTNRFDGKDRVILSNSSQPLYVKLDLAGLGGTGLTFAAREGTEDLGYTYDEKLVYGHLAMYLNFDIKYQFNVPEHCHDAHINQEFICTPPDEDEADEEDAGIAADESGHPVQLSLLPISKGQIERSQHQFYEKIKHSQFDKIIYFQQEAYEDVEYIHSVNGELLGGWTRNDFAVISSVRHLVGNHKVEVCARSRADTTDISCSSIYVTFGQ